MEHCARDSHKLTTPRCSYFIVGSAAAALVPTAREEYEAIKCSIKLYKTVH